MGYFIPETMKQFNNWVTWRKEENKKVPYDPRTGRRANPTKKCCDYEDALAFYQYGGNYDGIGFVFTVGCGLTFIDLDNCIDEEGNESPLAIEMQQLFKNTYIELSQSEKGLHIVCKGTVTKNIKTKEIEIYSSGRYMAMTGNSTNRNEPQEAQKQLNIIFDRYKAKEPLNEPQESPQGQIYECTQDAQTLIDIISHSRQGEKWQMLHNGKWQSVLDTKGRPYKSHSEAMQAYITITNYFAGGRIETIEGIFMQSRFPVENPKYKNLYYVRLAARKANETITFSSGSGERRKERIRTQEIEEFKECKRGRIRNRSI